jgi:hypothetical protein
MLKIRSIIPKSTNRYLFKNTVKAKYERNVDASFLSVIGLAVETVRLDSWEPHDIAITSALLTMLYKTTIEAIKNRIKLIPIKKRAIAIKKSSKI